MNEFIIRDLEWAVQDSNGSPHWKAKNAMGEIKFEFEVKVGAKGQKQAIFGRVSEITEGGLILLLPHELGRGTAVELEMADSTLYGTVLQTQPGTSSFLTTIQVHRVALGRTELSSILQRILSEKLPEISGLESSEATFD